MSEHETPFSKVRLEMLCDGIFCVAMTLLALELKVPELPKHPGSAAIWEALGEHAFEFAGFAVTFILAGQIWIFHHRLFQYLHGVNRQMVLLTIPFLMFVSLLPFSTSMLTTFGPREPVALTFYLGNQFVLSALLAVQWLLARRAGLVATGDDPERQRVVRVTFIQPISFLLALVVVYISPAYAMTSYVFCLVGLGAIVRRREKTRSVPAAS